MSNKSNKSSDRYEYESTIRLSNRQYAALRVFSDIGKRGALSARKGLEVDERSLKSMVYRGYVTFDARHGFKITDRGLERLNAWDGTNIYLGKPKTHYGSYLQSLNQALSGTFRQKPEQNKAAIPINHKRNTKARSHAA